MWHDYVQALNTTFGVGWQDNVIVLLQIGFIVALFPLFRKGADLPAMSSSLMTAFFVTIFVFVYATLEFWRTVIFTSILAAEWWAIAFLGWCRNGK